MGVIETRASARSRDPQDYDDYDCIECGGDGVIKLSYAEGYARDLQPWGDVGRYAQGARENLRPTENYTLNELRSARAGMLKHIAGKYPYPTLLSSYYDQCRRNAAMQSKGFRGLLLAESKMVVST
jgi:hypothetical protein